MAQSDTKWESTINELSELYQRVKELESENARLRGECVELANLYEYRNENPTAADRVLLKKYADGAK